MAVPILVLIKPGLMGEWPELIGDWQELHKLVPISERLDRIIVFRMHLHRVGQALQRQFPDAGLELDMDDLESRSRLSIAGTLWKLNRPRSALYDFVVSLQYALVERFLPRSYRKLYFADYQDALTFRTRLSGHVEAYPNRVAAAGGAERSQGTDLLFVGTLGYPPNEEASIYLASRLSPYLLRASAHPPTIVICGRGASANLASYLGNRAGVCFVPDAPDLASYYEKALAVVIPLRSGGGTKIKTIEAFAHSKAVVSTSEGVRGLAAIPEVHYLAAETVDEFARAIRRLQADPGLAARLGASARSLWEQRFRL